MLFRALSRRFGFLKTFGQRGVKQGSDNSPLGQFTQKKIYPSDKDAISIDLSKLRLDNILDTPQLKTNVPQLEHGLDKFLNGQLVFGDHGVGRFPQQNQQTDHQKIQQVSGYIQPSKDKILLQKGIQAGCRYISSTSSISNPLITLYYIFSCFRLPQTNNIYEGLPNKPLNWMVSYRKPVTFYLNKLQDNRQAIVSDHGIMPQDNKVLMNLGHIVQYFLTHKQQDTNAMMRGQVTKEVLNYYRYARVNNEIMLRSQIDCMSYDQNGNPFVFQIKSRACAPIRYDIENYKLYTDYIIDKKRGLFQSFQREYFDLIRGGFLKYVMQVKIGRMDGAFIAYHNTQKIYGYEYVKLKEMALRVFGDQYNLDVTFLCLSKMLTIVLDHIKNTLPQYKPNDLKIGFYAQNKSKKLMVMVQPLIITKQYHPIQKRTPEVHTIADYFIKVSPLLNPIFKIQFDFFMFINGIKLFNPDVLLTPHDTLEIKYKATLPIRCSTYQYLAFLREAYKEQEMYGNYIYKGMWIMDPQSSS